MTLGENLRLALAGLWANKLRALLTLLGIIIGIASVVAIMTISVGITQSVTNSLSSIGGTDMYLNLDSKENIAQMEKAEASGEYGYVDSTEVPEKEDSDYITADFVQKLREDFSDRIEGIRIGEYGNFGTATYRGKQIDASNNPSNQDFLIGSGEEMVAGRGFTAAEIEDETPLAVISEKMMKELYGGDKNQALDSTFTYESENGEMTFRVIGVYRGIKAKGIGGALTGGGNNSSENAFYIPYTLSEEANGTVTKGFNYATLRPRASGDLKTFKDELQRYCDKHWEQSQFGIYIFSGENVMKQVKSTFQVISLGLSAIAGLSLLVGGIGVMNIMLVSVTERTREIGIRKALGATRGNIRTQFLIEAMIVCLMGGILGVILGGIGGYYGGNAMGAAALPPIDAVVFALLFSTGIGVFFGYYPASKAAKLDPIEALRFE